jgi:hypothetical protein
MADATPHPIDGRPLLIVAHPGHELPLFHWMEVHKPTVFIMTDGSGGSTTSRLRYSEQCIQTTAAIRGSVFGAQSDRGWYQSILTADLAAFKAVIDKGVAAARQTQAKLIVSDAVDGYNPVHDLCEAIATAIRIALQTDNPGIQHLVSPAVPCPAGPKAVELHLDAAAQHRKQQAVAAYTPLAEEAQRLIKAGHTSLAEERLHHPIFTWPADFSPAWEQFGRQRVDHSRYPQAIEYRRHVRPIAQALIHDQY